MADTANQAPIIRRIKKGGGHAPHGGAWKVAYADFVTAMMAFFLLLWLLNATTEEQKQGISNYFAPASISQTNSGAGGMLAGSTVTSVGAMTSDRSQPSVIVGIPRFSEDKTITEEEAEAALAKREEEAFREVEEQLKAAIASDPELKELSKNLLVDRTPEGLRIQIVDEDKYAMFPSGRADMYERALHLMGKISKVIQGLPNKIAIRGHTDAAPYHGGQGGYSNWELSADRANSSRRALIASGLPPTRIVQVMGRADMEPLLADDPLSPRNRRISIILMREAKTGHDIAAAAGDPDQKTPPQQPAQDH